VIPGVQLFLYPEELEATEPEAVVERVRELGCDAVSVAVAYHRARRVFPRQRRVDVLTGSAFYVEPDAERYGALRPERTCSAALTDALFRFRAACARAEVRFRAWVVALHDERLARTHVDAAAQLVDGGPLGHSLCPSAPAAREYAASVAADVAAQLEPEAIDLEAALYPAWEPSYTLTLALEPLGEREQLLATQCFCRHCRELLGGSAGDLEHSARAGREGAEAELAPARAAGAARLLADVAAAVHDAGSELRVFAGGVPRQAALQGASAEALSAADALLLGCGPLAGEELHARFAALRELTGGRRATVSTNWTPERTPDGWAADVARLAAAGADGLALYNLTLVPERAFPALRAAAEAFAAR
jgi:hypothetical protein